MDEPPAVVEDEKEVLVAESVEEVGESVGVVMEVVVVVRVMTTVVDPRSIVLRGPPGLRSVIVFEEESGPPGLSESEVVVSVAESVLEVAGSPVFKEVKSPP